MIQKIDHLIYRIESKVNLEKKGLWFSVLTKCGLRLTGEYEFNNMKSCSFLIVTNNGFSFRWGCEFDMISNSADDSNSSLDEDEFDDMSSYLEFHTTRAYEKRINDIQSLIESVDYNVVDDSVYCSMNTKCGLSINTKASQKIAAYKEAFTRLESYCHFHNIFVKHKKNLTYHQIIKVINLFNYLKKEAIRASKTI